MSHRRKKHTFNNTPEEARKDIMPAPGEVAGSRTEIIPLDKMVLPEYQRDLKEETVKNIVNDYKPEKLGVLHVSERPDGTYAIVDGQHRMFALRRLGFKYASCVVFRGWTEQQESDYFYHQHDNTHNLSAKEKFKSGVYARYENEERLQEILTKNGFYSASGGRGTRIEAIAALNKIADIFNYEVLDQTLGYAATVWPGNRRAVCREMLGALAEFAYRFGEQVSPEQFQKRMQKYSPDVLVTAIRQNNSMVITRGVFSKDARFNACAVLVKYYNTGLGSTSKQRLHMIYRGN